jgi:hypothetical protein
MMTVVKEVRASIESHRDLIVWQRSMDLAVAAYSLLKNSEEVGKMLRSLIRAVER